MTVALPARGAAALGRARWPSLALVTVLSVLIASLARWGPDWPAQEFRAWVAAHDGLSLITTRWYSGSVLPSYSVLYPLLAGAFGGVAGAAVLGVLSCVVITWVASSLAPTGSRVRELLFGAAVAVGVTQNLLIGQVPFLMGSAFGLLALRGALRRDGDVPVAAFAALSSLASPLAGAFVLLVLPPVAVGRGLRTALPLSAALAGSVVALVFGGSGGPFPCPWITAGGVALLCAAILWLVPRENRAMHVFALCYLLFAVIAFLVPNPIGGNVARLGKLAAFPLACYFLPFDTLWRRAQAVLLAGLALLFPAVPFATSLAGGASDPTHSAAYYRGLDGYLARQPWNAGRLEIPFTHGHWEAYFVASKFPIARGWERQADLQYNAVLYHPLTASAYRRWLDQNAVRLVALPRASLDYGGAAEGALLRNPPAYLVPVWHDANWQVWRVTRPTALVSGPARVLDADPSSLTLRFTGAGTATVRMRPSRLWVTNSPSSCVGTSGGWLQVHSAVAGTVVVRAALSSALLGGSSTCVPTAGGTGQPSG